MLKRTLIAASALTLVVPAAAQAPAVTTQQVQFAPGTSSKAIKATIKGDKIIDYVVGARAGQTMSVTLNTSNASNYFNITAPGAQEALFVGSSGGNNFTGRLPVNGDYTVRVYLMRNAARRDETANFTLTIGVHAAQAAGASITPPGKGDPIAPGNMAAYCRGEVSGMYATRPNYVTTGKLVNAPGGGKTIDGTVDKGSEGIKKFECRFDAQGRFIDVMAMTRDGE